MGRKSSAKRQRRQTARFTVLSPGILEVLSIGKGDLKIEIGDSNADRARAQQMIEEMLHWFSHRRHARIYLLRNSRTGKAAGTRRTGVT